MTDEERKLALYCLKASSDYHSEVCEECIKYPNCDHTIQDDVTEIIIKALEQEPRKDDENELKFYYVESIDDYWIGQRLGNFYYANWDEDLGFVWSKSRYLPWGKHIVNENSLWKEHTYPSEPVEIPFTEWIVGFMKKYSTEPKIGYEKNHKKAKWKMHTVDNGYNIDWKCTNCGFTMHTDFFGYKYCPKCGAEMESD